MVANIYELTGKAAIARMRKRFAEDITREDAPLGIRTTFGAIVSKNTGNRKIESTLFATTDMTDSVEEAVARDGCDWNSYFAANGMNMFADHCYGVSSRVGYARALPVKVNTPKGRKGWLLTSLVDRTSTNPTIQAVVAGLLDGKIGASIGFEALEWGDPTPEEKIQYPGAQRIIRRCKILEVSFTYMPCNVECQTQYVSVDEEKAAEIENWAFKGMIPQSAMERLIIPKTKRVEVAPTPPPEPTKRKTVILVDA